MITFDKWWERENIENKWNNQFSVFKEEAHKVWNAARATHIDITGCKHCEFEQIVKDSQKNNLGGYCHDCGIDNSFKLFSKKK